MYKPCISKKKIYTSILGLFLTAAMPLCVSIAAPTAVYAAEKEEKQPILSPSCSHQQVLPLEEIKKKNLDELVHLLWKEKSSSDVKYEIIPNTSTEKSSYNLGQALRTLYEKDPSINTWLAEIRNAFSLPPSYFAFWSSYTPPCYQETLPVLQEKVIKDISLTLYNLMHAVSVQLPSAFDSSTTNYEKIVEDKVKSLEKIKRLAM